MNLTRKVIAVAMATAMATPAMAADDEMAALKAEFKRLAERIETLERHNKEMEKGLATNRISESEPELATRLKAVEFQTLSMQKQARQISALEDITVGASLTGVLQKVMQSGTPGGGAGGTATGGGESRASYRGDISVTLPGGKMGDIDGKIFTHFRLGQGTGVPLRRTYTSTVNTTAFQTNAGADDSFAILAQGWYQLAVPLPRDGIKANSKERLNLTFGKIDPFVFFDQNAAADDESAKFLNNVFVHNPLLDSGGGVRADAYGFAPGAIVQYGNAHEKGSEWGLSLGVFGSGPGANFSNSLAGPFVIAQAQTATRFNYLPGNYRAYLWQNGRGNGYDNVERRHSGIGISADQKVTDELTLFGRYGHQLKGQVRFDRALTLGTELSGSRWGRGADSFGVALGALRTSEKFRNDSLTIDANADGTPDFGYQASGWEKQLELYYRFKVNSRFELSPDIQLIQGPAADGAGGTIKVFGLRARIGF
ncbi:MAG: carbohydrate porin [Rhodocyclales bacterium]|nr:carbohydrate porin [Rhodocyclales bacterium]